MPITSEEVKAVADNIQTKLNEFSQKNDEKLTGLEKKQAEVDETLTELKEKLGEVDELKAGLEEELLSIKRPGAKGASKEEVEYKNSFFNDFVRKGKDETISQKSVNTGTDADGGFAVPEEIDSTIVKLAKDINVMRQVCGSVTVGTPEYKQLVSLGGAASGWVGETDARGETNSPKLAEAKAIFGEIYANPQVTQRALDDIFFNVEAWLTSEVADEFNEKEEAAFTTGDGTNKPKGLFAYPTATTADGTRAFGTFQHIVSGEIAKVNSDDLINLVYAVKKKYRSNGAYMMNSATLALVRKLKDSNGNYMWQPAVQKGEPSTLNGYPVYENEQVADVAADALAIAFGDFKKCYKVVDRMGTRVLRDPYSNKPYVGFYTTKRVGSLMTDSNAVKFLKIKKA